MRPAPFGLFQCPSSLAESDTKPFSMLKHSCNSNIYTVSLLLPSVFAHRSSRGFRDLWFSEFSSIAKVGKVKEKQQTVSF